MLSQNRLEKIKGQMRNPLALCDSIGAKPSSRQYEMLVCLADCPRTYEVAGDDGDLAARACCIFALWRLLDIPGSQGIILADTQEHAAGLMMFMEAITKRTHPQLAQVTAFPRWNVLKFGSQEGWALRMMPNKAALVAERAPEAVVSIIIGAKNDEPEFFEACRALEKGSTHPKNTLIKVW